MHDPLSYPAIPRWRSPFISHYRTLLLSRRNCQGGHAWAHPFSPSYSLMALLYFMNRVRWFIQTSFYESFPDMEESLSLVFWAHFHHRDRQPSVPLCLHSSKHQTHWLVHKIVLLSNCINAFIATFSQVKGQPRGIGTGSRVCQSIVEENMNWL